MNNGKGIFSKSKALPKMNTAGKSVTAADYDKDGDIDLFVGGYVIPGRYPEAPRSYLLENNNGTFTDVTASKAPDAMQHLMVSDAVFSDIDGDGDLDLVTVAEWSKVTTYLNTENIFAKAELPSLEKPQDGGNILRLQMWTETEMKILF